MVFIGIVGGVAVFPFAAEFKVVRAYAHRLGDFVVVRPAQVAQARTQNDCDIVFPFAQNGRYILFRIQRDAYALSVRLHFRRREPAFQRENRFPAAAVFEPAL